MLKEREKLKVSGVSINVKEDIIEVKGNLGIIRRRFSGSDIDFKENGVLIKSKTSYGTFRGILKNMIWGVTKGYYLECNFVGLGYRFVHLGDRIIFKLGFSHYIRYEIPSTVYIVGYRNKLIIYSVDIEEVGKIASKLSKFRKKDSYKGKGIYIGEPKLELKIGKKR